MSQNDHFQITPYQFINKFKSFYASKIQNWYRGLPFFNKIKSPYNFLKTIESIYCRKIQNWYRGILCFKYCRMSNIIHLKNLLTNKGVNVNLTNKNKDTCLHSLCYENFIDKRLEKIKLLLSRKNLEIDKLNKFNMTPLMKACYMGFTDISILLINNGANSFLIKESNFFPGNILHSPLYFACLPKYFSKKQKKFIKKQRFKKGLPLYESKHKIVRYLLENQKSNEYERYELGICLHKATKYCFIKIIKLLLQYGADINYIMFNQRPIHVLLNKYDILLRRHNYTEKNYYKVLNLLIKNGSKLNEDRKNLVKSTLEVAINRIEDSNVVKILLENKAKPNVIIRKDENESLLLNCIKYIYLNQIYLKIIYHKEIGDFLSDREYKGFIKQYEDFINIINLLLKYGANPNIKNKYGNTVLFYAYLNGDINLINTICMYNKINFSKKYINKFIKINKITFLNSWHFYTFEFPEIITDQYRKVIQYYDMVKYWTPWHFMVNLQEYFTSRELIMNNIIKRKFQNKINFDSCTCIFDQEEDHKNDSDCKKPSKTLQQLINSHNMEDVHKCELKEL